MLSMEMARVLIIDDDVALCRLLAERLSSEDFSMEAIHKGQRGLERVLSQDYALVILDLMLPGMKGLDVLRHVRERSAVPVLILTARGEDVDRILGLEIGADDYLPKPFNPRELIARIHAILRRTHYAKKATGPLVVDDIRLDRTAREAWVNKKLIDLTSVEFSLLETLLDHAGQVVTREQLTEVVLGRKLGPFDRVIDVHVSNVRRKLIHASDAAERIKAIRGSGYLFVVRSEEK
jgi:DNA-binding response OmpR family regulator